MTRRYRELAFSDELLPDGIACRTYADGHQEWRSRERDSVVVWRDDRGRSGQDELLANRIIKRRIWPNTVLYGRDIGYGRTTWSDGTLTINRTSLGGRASLIIAGIGAAGLLPAVIDPPFQLTPEEEEELRQQQAEQASSSGGGSADYADASSPPLADTSSDPSSDTDWVRAGDATDDFG